MDINDSDNLKECNDEQRHRAHIAVEDLHPVVPRTQGEEECRQEAYHADDCWENDKKNGFSEVEFKRKKLKLI